MSSIEFANLLRKPAGEAKKPPVLPAGAAYAGIVKSWELGNDNKNKTPYLRVHVGLVGWDGSIPESWTEFDPSTNETRTINKSEIDLSKRQLRRDFYLRGKDANDASAEQSSLYRLDTFLRTCQIEPRGRTYEEVLPELQNKPLLVDIQQQLNTETSLPFNQIDKLAGAQ